MKMAVSYININKQADKSLAELINLGRRYVAGAEALWPKYREACNRNKGLYTSEAMEQQKQEAKREYRAQLLNTFNEMWMDVSVEVDLMRDALAAWVSEPGDPAFLAQISAYKDFGLTLSKTELEALVEGAAGNYVALRCLDTLAHKSGFRVNIPSVNDFGRDLDQIRMDFWNLRLYGPVGDGDVLDLLPDVVSYSGMQMGAPTVTQATMAWQAARNLDKHLEEIRGRWSSSVQPMVTVTEDVYGADQQDTQEEAERIKTENTETRTTPENVTVESSDTDGVERQRTFCRPPALTGEVQANAPKGAGALRGVHFVADSTGKLKVWSPPPKHHCRADRFLTVVDIGGRSESSDFSVIAVLDLGEEGDEPPTVAAQWRGHTDHDLLAWKAAQIALWYHRSLLVIESNTLETEMTEGENSGFILHEIADVYPNIYYRHTLDPTTGNRTASVGFHTNRSTKPLIVNHHIAAVRDTAYRERDTEAVNELTTYERKSNGSFGAKDGYHDDILMTRCIGLFIAHELRHNAGTPVTALKRPG